MATPTASNHRLGAYALALMIAGCSSASSAPSSQNDDSGAPADAGAVAQSEGSTGGDGGNVCAGIVADVQALVVPKISGLQNINAGCIALLASDGGQLPMQVLYNVDADMSLYNQDSGEMRHPITGVGDEAYWIELAAGVSIPHLLAHKGNETCIPTSDSEDLRRLDARVRIVAI